MIRSSLPATADPNLYFNPAAFTRPANGTFTTQRNRNLLYNPGLPELDRFTVQDLPATESARRQFRGEVYNIPNHPNWNNPTSESDNSTFGKVTNKNFERTFQLSLRYCSNLRSVLASTGFPARESRSFYLRTTNTPTSAIDSGSLTIFIVC